MFSWYRLPYSCLTLKINIKDECYVVSLKRKNFEKLRIKHYMYYKIDIQVRDIYFFYSFDVFNF